MSVIALVLVLGFLAVILWFVNTKFPNANKTIVAVINAVIVIIAIIFALSAFGVWDQVKDVQVPKL